MIKKHDIKQEKIADLLTNQIKEIEEVFKNQENENLIELIKI